MHEFLSFFQNKSFSILLTILMVLVLQIGRILSVKYIEKYRSKNGEDYRHTVNFLKNIINLLTLVFVFILWSSEIQQFAISIAAFTVAIVLATKELLQSFLGFIYINSSRIFKVGDWIKIGDYLGEVHDISWSKTSMLEISPDKYHFTGRTTFISNNLLLSLTIQNLNFMKRYVPYTFSLVKEGADVNPYVIKAALLDKINHHCLEFENVAERYNNVLENKLGIKMDNEPHIEITTTNIGKIEFKISFFCPTEKIQILIDKISFDFFSLWYEQVDNQCSKLKNKEKPNINKSKKK